jgi:hypothetical protein
VQCSASSSFVRRGGFLLIRKVVLPAKAANMNHCLSYSSWVWTVKEETRLGFIANLILRESWYKPVLAIATLTLNRFQFFCNFIRLWSKMSNKERNQHGNFL